MYRMGNYGEYPFMGTGMRLAQVVLMTSSGSLSSLCGGVGVREVKREEYTLRTGCKSSSAMNCGDILGSLMPLAEC